MSSRVERRLGRGIYDHPTTATNVDRVVVSQTYDWLGRLLTRTYPDTGVERFGHGYCGLTAYTNQLTQRTQFAYDVAGRKTNEITPNQESLSYVYSAADDLLTLMDGLNHRTDWGYNAEGLVTSKTNHNRVRVLAYQYDANQRLTNRWSVAKGNTAYTRDPVGKATKVTYPVSPAITNRYDALNRLTNMVDALGTTRYAYSADGLLAYEDGPWENEAVSYVHTNGLRTNLALQQPNGAAGTNGYAYDWIRRLTNITSPAGRFGYRYYAGMNGEAPASQLIQSLFLPNGAAITRSYDGLVRLLSVTTGGSQGLIESHGYQYDDANRRTRYARTLATAST